MNPLTYDAAYPIMSTRTPHDDLVEYFKLHTDDFDLLKRIRLDFSRLGFAVLLKSFNYLGYPPQTKSDIPEIVINWISGQLGLDAKLFEKYQWKSRTWDHHISIIRNHTGYRPFEGGDACLHLLQNALILVNTIMVERVLCEENMMHRMKAEDRSALTPLFTLNINPYGSFSLDFEKPSILEAA